MSSIDFATAPQLNGNGLVANNARREAEFLDKLLQIRNEVLTDKHPRIKLPPAVLEELAPSTSTQLFADSLNRTPRGGQPQQQHLLPPRPETAAQHASSSTTYSSPSHVPRPTPPKPSSSGIDPVLLTKSDHLIRAELQLKRQHIERTLRDQLDKKGRAAFAEDRETYLDVDDVLTKAQALVPPVSGLSTAAVDSEGSTSFDENSYYSSQANSWSHGEHSPIRSPHSANADGTLPSHAQQSSTEALTAASATDHAGSAQAQPTVIDLDEEPYEPAEDIEIYEPEPIVDLDQDESDYSPPPAATGPSESARKGRPRVRGAEASNTGSRRQSPAGHPAPIQNPRKRRRAEVREERRRQQGSKRAVRSPEPYIKEEPQSPPMAGYPDSQPNKRRALQVSLMESESSSTRGGRMQPIHYQDLEHSPRSYRPYDEAQSPTVVHAPPRILEPDDQDLRRVASLQHARRPYSPRAREVYPAVEMRPVRAASHAFADRPPEPMYGEVSRHPSVAPRILRERSRSPAREYLPQMHSPGPMAPPSRTIVVDQYGNRYYAAPMDVRESVVPLRRMEAEAYHERAVTREPTMRGPTRDVYGDEGVVRMPPPPPPPPRRYVEVLDSDVMEARPYGMREASRRPLEVDYAGPGVVERRPIVQYEEVGPRRDYVPSRAYSVRPEVVRREVAEEYVPLRHGSMAPRPVSVAGPRYREISVAHPELPHEAGRYTYSQAPQSRRYVDEAATEGVYRY
ncbi:uncharacterized protein EI97DRAFT_430309 [Westerdykella ornata]|uniref:Uncharacterized protein n=1 Tax=Westerdykella ornata TaxID=318751 RepID=A0A6A6JSH5_WESOR|nr:uncharacterized protein EI97DRAFT_430309 [Westerdykella ornata]KAF2279215.1 hypothetical protein EI97DRAFT_430309 [Westerdykella ornata]